MIRGRPKVQLAWNSNRSLTIEVTFVKGTAEFVWRKNQVLDVTVQWVVVEERAHPVTDGK